MINYLENDGRLTFKVRVVPRASRSEIVGEHDGLLKVRLTAPPVDDAANAALVQVLARAFGLPSSAVEIISGQHSRTKTVSIAGSSFESLARLLNS